MTMLAMHEWAPGVYLIGGVRYTRSQALRLVDALVAMLAADEGSASVATQPEAIVGATSETLKP